MIKENVALDTSQEGPCLVSFWNRGPFQVLFRWSTQCVGQPQQSAHLVPFTLVKSTLRTFRSWVLSSLKSVIVSLRISLSTFFVSVVSEAFFSRIFERVEVDLHLCNLSTDWKWVISRMRNSSSTVIVVSPPSVIRALWAVDRRDEYERASSHFAVYAVRMQRAIYSNLIGWESIMNVVKIPSHSLETLTTDPTCTSWLCARSWLSGN